MTEFNIRIFTSGCRLNQAEEEEILENFYKYGGRLSSSYADVCVINTCTVTSNADRKSRALIRKVKKLFPSSLIVITGCYATTDFEKLKKDFSDAIIIPNSEKNIIAQKVLPLLTLRKTKNENIFLTNKIFLPQRYRSRFFLKIQSGCDEKCSYCKVRIARGKSTSVPLRSIVEKVLKASEKYEEIVLTGVNLLSWKDDKKNFADLMNILCNLKIPVRYRLSSMEPMMISDEILDTLKDPKICDHFHICFQSGDSSVLSLMNRDPETDRFFYIVEKLRKMRSDAAIGADLIVGFPGESDKSFENTLNLVRDLKISHLHLFRYSKREGTIASFLTDTVPENIIDERYNILLSVGEENKKKFILSMAEKVFSFVKEHSTFLSSNYISAYPPPLIKLKNERLVKGRLKISDNMKVYIYPLEKGENL